MRTAAATPFDMELGNVKGAIPIHGFLGERGVEGGRGPRRRRRRPGSTSRLEFFRNPAWMKQFPFAHTIEITHRLHDGALEVHTRIENLGLEPMPVSIGFHPYFSLTDAPRDEWTIAVGARTQWLLAENKVPTGETRPIERLFPDPRRGRLEGLPPRRRVHRSRPRRAGPGGHEPEGTVAAARRRAGPELPRGRDLRAGRRTDRSSASSRWSGITNAMNAAHKGLYKELQTHPGRRHVGGELLGAAERILTERRTIRVIRDGSSP